MGSQSLNSSITALLNGRNRWGTAPSGVDQNGTQVGITQQTPGYFSGNEGSEGGWSYNAINPRVAPNGTGVVIDGNYRQVGHLSPDQLNSIYDRAKGDPDGLKYDDTFGLLANDKYIKPNTTGDALINALMFAAVGGAAFSGIGAIEGWGGGAGATGGMDTWEPGTAYTGGSAPGGAGGSGFGPGGFDSWEPGTGYTGGSAPGGIPETGQFPYMDNLPDPQQLPMNNLMDPGYLPRIDPMLPPGGQQSWYQQAIQNALKDPLNTARTGMGLYSMVNSLAGQHGSSALLNGVNGGGSDGSSGSAPMFTPDLQTQFQMNPFLLRPVPFMSGG